MTIGIALLGTGSIAERAFVPAVQAVDEASLVAVLSRDATRGATFAQKHGIPAAYDDLDTLLRSPQVDAVIVATPDATHEAQVIAASRAGKHILCEKPMTHTYAGCERMAEAIRANGITFAMGYNNRFNSGLRHVKTMIENGDIGSVRYARALLTSRVQDPEGWRAQGEQSRYWALSAVGTHLIDFFRWYFGEPMRIGGGLTAPVYQGLNDEISTLVFDYPVHLHATLSVGSVFGDANRLELYGAEGAIIGEGLFGSNPKGAIWYQGQDMAYESTNPFIGEVADFVEAIQQQRQPCATLEDGMRNVYIMETARDSALLQSL